MRPRHHPPPPGASLFAVMRPGLALPRALCMDRPQLGIRNTRGRPDPVPPWRAAWGRGCVGPWGAVPPAAPAASEAPALSRAHLPPRSFLTSPLESVLSGSHRWTGLHTHTRHA